MIKQVSELPQGLSQKNVSKHRLECKKCKNKFVHEFERSELSYVTDVVCPKCWTKLKVEVQGSEYENLSEHKYQLSKWETLVVMAYAKYKNEQHDVSLNLQDALHDIIKTAAQSLKSIGYNV